MTAKAWSELCVKGQFHLEVVLGNFEPARGGASSEKCVAVGVCWQEDVDEDIEIYFPSYDALAEFCRELTPRSLAFVVGGAAGTPDVDLLAGIRSAALGNTSHVTN